MKKNYLAKIIKLGQAILSFFVFFLLLSNLSLKAEQVSVGQMASRCVKEVVYTRSDFSPCKKLPQVTKSTVTNGVGQTIEFTPSWKAHIVGDEENIVEKPGYYESFLNKNFTEKYIPQKKDITLSLGYDRYDYFSEFDLIKIIDEVVYQVAFERPPYAIAKIDLTFLPKLNPDYYFDLRPLFEFVYLLVDITNFFKSEVTSFMLSVNENYQILAQSGRMSCSNYDLSSGILDCKRLANTYRLIDNSTEISNGSIEAAAGKYLSYRDKFLIGQYFVDIASYSGPVGGFIRKEVSYKVKARSIFTQAAKYALEAPSGQEVAVREINGKVLGAHAENINSNEFAENVMSSLGRTFRNINYVLTEANSPVKFLGADDVLDELLGGPEDIKYFGEDIVKETLPANNLYIKFLGGDVESDTETNKTKVTPLINVDESETVEDGIITNDAWTDEGWLTR